VKPRLGASPLGGLDDVVRGREVRLACTEADDRPAAALSALALASTASVADSEIAETRAETLVDMCFILPPADSGWHVI